MPGAREDLAGDEEGDEPFGQPLEGHVPADQVVLVAAVGVAGGVRVVLEEQDVAGDAVFAEPLLRLVQQVLDDALARLVMDDEVGDVVALGRGVLGMEARVEIEAGAVLEEDVGVAGARDDLLEEVPRHVVGRQAALAVQGAGEAVLVLEAEDAPLHVRTQANRGAAEGKDVEGGRQRNQGCASSARSWWSTSGGMRRNFRRSLLAVEHRHLEVALGQRLVLGDHQGADAQLDRGGEVEALLVVVLQVAPDLVGLPAHRRVVLLVLDRAVVEDVVDLVLRAVVAVADLDDQHLDLEGLDVLGEDVAEGLGVGVGEGLGADVARGCRSSP